MSNETQGPEMTEAYDWKGRKVVDRDGEKVGKVEAIYEDNQSGELEWVLVDTGLFGGKSNFVPLAGARPAGEDVQVNFSKEQIKDAPGIVVDGELSPDEERELFDYYGIGYAAPSSGADATSTADDARSTADDATTAADDAMTRSEEELTVGTRRRQTGRVRLRKYVVTETVTKKVPVRREKVVLERVPVTDENVEGASQGTDISEEEHEVVLHEEEIVTNKRVVPKERIRLGKEVEETDERVSEEVRKERIEAEGDLEG